MLTEQDITLICFSLEVILSLVMYYSLYRRKTFQALFFLVLSTAISLIHTDAFRNDTLLAFAFLNAPVYLLSLALIKIKYTKYVFLILFGLIPLCLPVVLMGPLVMLYYSSLIASAVTMRNSVRMDVLTTLSNCLKQNMPLSTALAQAANGGKSKSARILRETAQWLAEGYSLSEALKKSYRSCPVHIISLLAMAEDVDQLPQAARYIEQQLFEKRNGASWVSQSNYNIFMYPFMICSMAILMVCGMMVFVVPKFKAIFADMGSDLPTSTRWLLDATSYFFDSHAAPFLLIILPALILFIFFMQIFYPRRSGNPSLFTRVGDSFKWYCPGLHWFAASGSHIRIIEYFRMSLISGKSLDKIIGNCINLDVNLYFRHKLRIWHKLVVSGVPVAQAARNAGISKSLAWCFDNNCGPGNTENALTMLQKNYAANYEYRSNIVKEYAGPIFIILCALFVGFVCFAMFTPMVEMINSIMSTM